MSVSRETLRQEVEEWKNANGNAAEAARRLDVAVSTLKDHLKLAAAQNIGGLGGAVGGELPLGLELTGTSTYYRVEKADGTMRGQWVKTRVEKGLSDFIKAIRSGMEEYRGRFEAIALPEGPFDDDLLALYPIADHHLGMYAWKRETGESYDLDIAEAALKLNMAKLVGRMPRTREAIVLGLGDFFHADNNRAETEQHHNKLDVDSRYQKVLHKGVELWFWSIDLALSQHEHVYVRVLPGNHDPYAALALAEALWAAYQNEPRVTVDIDPSRFFVFRWGKTMIAATHGDKVKPMEMPALMAARWPQVWGETEFRYALLGHVHHSSKGADERGGVLWETFQTLAAKDSYANEMGHNSGRSITAILYHIDGGEYERKIEHVRKGDL